MMWKLSTSHSASMPGRLRRSPRATSRRWTSLRTRWFSTNRRSKGLPAPRTARGRTPSPAGLRSPPAAPAPAAPRGSAPRYEGRSARPGRIRSQDSSGRSAQRLSASQRSRNSRKGVASLDLALRLSASGRVSLLAPVAKSSRSAGRKSTRAHTQPNPAIPDSRASTGP